MIVTQAMREIMGEATRAGVTKETIGQYHNLAWRAKGRGDTEMETRCLRRCLEVHNTWGARLPESYSMGPDTLARITDRLKELGAHE